MSVDLEQTPLIKVLARLAIPIVQRGHSIMASLDEPEHLGPLVPAEEYVASSFLSAGHVLTVCSQLQHSAAYISQFRGTPKLRRLGVNRFTHIIYHLENHVIRTRIVFDRVLILTNVVFRLGNSEKNCTRDTVLKNQYIQESDVLQPLKELDAVLQQTRPTANVVLHRRGYDEPLLGFAELHYLVEEAGQRALPSHFVKAEIDRFVIRKERQIFQVNDKILEPVAQLFSDLGPICERIYRRLAESGEGSTGFSIE